MMMRTGWLMLLILLMALPGWAADWTQFRGPSGIAATENFQVPDEWTLDKNLAWKVKIPGAGWAQPIVVGDQIFVATAVSDPPLTPKNMMAGVMDPRSRPDPTRKAPAPGPDVKIDWQLLSIDRKTGKTTWTKTITSGKPKYAIHPSNTYATETPASDGERVYVFFGATGTVAALDRAGKEVWKKELGAYPGNADLGLGASPLLHEGKLFIPLLNEDRAEVLCLDTKTGKELYSIKRDKAGTSWSTPFLWKNKVRTELVICGKGSVTSHDLKDGSVLWTLGEIDSSFSSTPAATAEVIVFGNGGPGSKSPLFGIKAGAKGELTVKDPKSEAIAFYKLGAAPGMASPIASGGYVFVLNNGGLSCLDPLSGDLKFKERIPKTRTVAASPFSANGKLYFLDESGTFVVIKAAGEFEVVASNKIEDTFWSSPTPAGDQLLLRGVEYLYCIKK